MARYEQDREDLMREATALVRRVELLMPGYSEPCVVGMRRGGEVSIFVGADPVFQFNSRGELRRGFWNGRLLKAERGRLVALDRQRTKTEVQLVRSELTEAQTSEFLALTSEMLGLLRRALRSGDLVVWRQVPEESNAIAELTTILNSVPEKPVVASAPNVEA